jgi:Fe2+ or Zn2+ uptake regulation protein
MSFATIVTEDQRLVILRALEQAPGYDHNESVLQTFLRKIGHSVSRDKVRTELRWLEEQGLVSINEVLGVLVATLTGRGVDVVKGMAVVDGVKRPRPGA